MAHNVKQVLVRHRRRGRRKGSHDMLIARRPTPQPWAAHRGDADGIDRWLACGMASHRPAQADPSWSALVAGGQQNTGSPNRGRCRETTKDPEELGFDRNRDAANPTQYDSERPHMASHHDDRTNDGLDKLTVRGRTAPDADRRDQQRMDGWRRSGVPSDRLEKLHPCRRASPNPREDDL